MTIHTWHIVGVAVPYFLIATALWGLAAGAIKNAVAVGTLPERIDGRVGGRAVRLPTVPVAYALALAAVGFIYGCVLDRTHMAAALGADPHALAPGADDVLYGLAGLSWLSATLLTGGYGWLRRGTRRMLEAPADRDRAEQRYRILARHLTDLVTHHHPDGRCEWVSASVQSLLGYTPQELLGRDPYEFIHPDDAGRVREEGHQRLLDGRAATTTIRYRIRHAAGHYLWVESLTESIVDAGGEVVGLQVATRDVTERQAIEDELRRRTLHDPLTGLPNRTLLTQRIEACVGSGNEERRAGRFAVLYVDLDRFKAVNDVTGHAAGDAVLVEFAVRLRAATRVCDTVARIGGDEFAVLLDGIAGEAEAVDAARRIERALAAPFEVGGVRRRLAASIGIVVGRPDHAAAGDVLREADLATYQAKARRRGAGVPSWALFTEGLREANDRRRRIEADLDGAVARGELCVAYQPIVDLEHGGVVGVEALLRWNHPALGLLAPGAFIDIAEETGRIGELDRWVLGEGLRQLRRWEAALGPLDLTLAVNCSARDLHEPAFGQSLRAAVEACGPGRLVVEITESALVDDSEAAASVLQGLSAHGVRFAMDDFGTGYSSLSMIHALPVDEIKIDRTFVQRMHEDATARGMVETIVGFARTLGAEIVAEGIETPEQEGALRAIGCEYGQGYLFARPLAPEAVAEMLRAQVA